MLLWYKRLFKNKGDGCRVRKLKRARFACYRPAQLGIDLRTDLALAVAPAAEPRGACHGARPPTSAADHGQEASAQAGPAQDNQGPEVLF